MTRLALSTMFAQHERFEDGAVFAAFAKEAGFDAIEISHSTPPAKFEQVVESGIIPIVSVHQPAPLVVGPDGRENHGLNLAALDATERAEAVEAAVESVRWAARHGAESLVVHMGHVVSPEARAAEAALKTLWPDTTSSEANVAREEAIEERDAVAGWHLEAAHLSLKQIVSAAQPEGIVVGVESRIGYTEIPLADEAASLLAGVAPEAAGYWHDTGHGEVLDRLGFVPLGDWQRLLGDRLVGAHVHDVDGIRDHRALGQGDADFSTIAPWLSTLPSLTMEIDQHQPDDAVRATRVFLQSVALA